ncbi:MAG: hypothetical protein SGJ20_07375 [Planctomycetota bacterium]|nr:hypothetical protein [Planctomycetota bacterium]
MSVVRVNFILLVCCLFSAADLDRRALAADDLAPSMRDCIGSAMSRHLLLDSRVVDQIENATLIIGTVKKAPANPLFREDKPWEPRYDNMYPSVIYDSDEGLYKCWYTPFVTSQLEENTPRNERESVKWTVSQRRFGLCYAVSPDGLEWKKPDLGLVELHGSKRNNLVMFDVHGPDVIKDMRETDPSRRYKMFGTLGDGPHMVWFSPDGLHWSDPIRLNLGGRSDTHNNVLWSPERREFVGFTRHGATPRNVARTSSRDFVHWSKVREILTPEPDQPELHDMVVFAYSGVYLGLIGVFDVAEGRQWVELAWSPDTVRWHRIQPGKSLIPNGSKNGVYDWGCIFATRPIVQKNETRIYYAGCNGKFFDWRDGSLCMATLPKDRWAGYGCSDDRKGTILTQPLTCSASKLLVTADAKGGAVEIDVLDEAGNWLSHSEPLCGDVTDAQIYWTDAAAVKSAVGKRVRLRLRVDRAIVYSFAFVD